MNRSLTGAQTRSETELKSDNFKSGRDKKIMVLRPENGIDESDIRHKIEALRSLAATHDASQIKKFLRDIVPEYVLGDSEAVL